MRRKTVVVPDLEKDAPHVELRDARVRCNTTAGELTIYVKKDWSPNGVQR
jgi:hypothetical protein